MTNRSLLLILPPLFILSGCATHLSAEQCQNTNWLQVGLNDGAAGKGMSDLNKEITDCAKFGINVNLSAYNKGWRDGNKQYCTFETGYALGNSGHEYPFVCQETTYPRVMKGWHKGSGLFCQDPLNGFNLGKSGGAYPSTCRNSMYAGFQTEYQRGFAINQRTGQLQQDISTAEQNLRNKQYELDAINRDIDSKHHHLKENPQLAQDIRQLQRNKTDKEVEIQLIQARLDRLRADLFKVNVRY
jgi:hypothetical protein